VSVAPVTAAPELAFSVAEAQPLARAAVPTVALRLVAERTAGAPVVSATIGVRVDVAPALRANDGASDRLRELFGTPDQWGSTLGTLPWVRTTVLAGAFDERTTLDLLLPGSYDFDVAAVKYADALDGGDLPLELMFSGTMLYEAGGAICAAPIPWDRQASYRLPMEAWRAAMRAVFGESPWVRLRRDRFDRLCDYKARAMLPTLDDAVDALLRAAEEA
jgi:hypothetical protein